MKFRTERRIDRDIGTWRGDFGFEVTHRRRGGRLSSGGLGAATGVDKFFPDLFIPQASLEDQAENQGGECKCYGNPKNERHK